MNSVSAVCLAAHVSCIYRESNALRQQRTRYSDEILSFYVKDYTLFSVVSLLILPPLRKVFSLIWTENLEQSDRRRPASSALAKCQRLMLEVEGSRPLFHPLPSYADIKYGGPSSCAAAALSLDTTPSR